MSGLFSTPSPAPAPAPVVPTREDPAVDEAKRAEQLRARKAKGFASTVLFGDEGEETEPLTVAAQLLKPGGASTQAKLGGGS